MKAIDKAWKENLQEPKDDQWESKEDLIENCCPHGEFCLKLKGFKNDDELCSYYDEDCTRCWNTEIDEDQTIENASNKLTFEQLEKSPLEHIELNYSDNEAFENSVLKSGDVIYIEHTRLRYNNLPQLIKWLQDVYDYCKEIKNKIKYVDFNFAKMHMINGDKAMFEDETYYIKNGELYCEDLNSACALKLRAIESDKWILL